MKMKIAPKEVKVDSVHRLDVGYRVACTLVGQVYNLKTGQVIFESADEKEAKEAFRFIRGGLVTYD